VTLDELKTWLNELRTDVTWKHGWVQRGAHVGAVVRCIRDLLDFAADRERIGDDAGCQAWIKHIVEYAVYKHWDEQAAKPRPYMSPDLEIITAEEAAATFAHRQAVPATLPPAQAAWLRFLDRLNPDITFRQARLLFRQDGCWSEWDWPGMPLSRLDRMARIRDVPAARRHPTPGIYYQPADAVNA
jgi:hypothetical protein